MQIRVRVRYAETDQMGVVYHANYLVWMELGRVELCRSRGLNYRDLESEAGIYLGVVEAHCRYHAPARYDDVVLVTTTIARAHPRMMRFTYEMTREEDGVRLATGETAHIFFDRSFKRCRLPEKYRPAFGIDRADEETSLPPPARER